MMIDEHLHFTKEIPPENSPHPVGCTRRDMSPSWTDSQASRWKTVENRGVSVSKWGRSFQKMKDERNSQLGIKSEKEMHTPWSVQPCTTLVERNWNIDRLCWIDLCQQCMRKHIYDMYDLWIYRARHIFRTFEGSSLQHWFRAPSWVRSSDPAGCHHVSFPGWWFFAYPSEKSWTNRQLGWWHDPNIWKKKNMFQTTNQFQNTYN